MGKKTFATRTELDNYFIKQKQNLERGILVLPEREELKRMIAKPDDYITKKEVIKKGLPIITNIRELKKPCAIVEKGEDVNHIIKALKETLSEIGGFGLSANQIGFNKRISYIKVPKAINKKQLAFSELILINPKIIERDNPVKFQGEGCLSFPGIFVDTKRYIFCTVQFEDENRKPQVLPLQDMESFAVQHEIDHQNGIVIFNRHYKDINHRK